MIASSKESLDAFMNAYQRLVGLRPQKGRIPEAFRRAVKTAAQGKAFETVSFDLSYLSDFQRRVLKALLRVPRGKTQTYGGLARKAGKLLKQELPDMPPPAETPHVFILLVDALRYDHLQTYGYDRSTSPNIA